MAAVPSAYGIKAESGSRDAGEPAGADPPGGHANRDEDTDMSEELDEEPKSGYSSEHEPIGAN